MYSIRVVGTDLWLGKKNLTYFFFDDSHLSLLNKTINDINFKYWSVSYKNRRIFATTAEIRRSMGSIMKETVKGTITLNNGLDYETLIKNGPNRATYSNYEVVDLVNNKVYPLDDVLAKKV